MSNVIKYFNACFYSLRDQISVCFEKIETVSNLQWRTYTLTLEHVLLMDTIILVIHANVLFLTFCEQAYKSTFCLVTENVFKEKSYWQGLTHCVHCTQTWELVDVDESKQTIANCKLAKFVCYCFSPNCLPIINFRIPKSLSLLLLFKPHIPDPYCKGSPTEL